MDLSWPIVLPIGGEVTKKSEPYLSDSKDHGKVEKTSLKLKVNESDSVV